MPTSGPLPGTPDPSKTYVVATRSSLPTRRYDDVGGERRRETVGRRPVDDRIDGDQTALHQRIQVLE